MKNYILKPKFVRKSEILNKDTLSVRDLGKIANNSNLKKLKSLITKSFINSNVESQYYFPKSEYFLLTNKAINSNSLLLDSTKLVAITPNGFRTKNSCPVQINDILVGNNGSVGDCLIIKENKNIITNSNLTLIRLNENVDNYYILGILYTNWFKSYCKVISSKSGTQEFITRNSLEQIDIPFPTKNSHPEPQKIEQLVSLITQNIIDKEERIKAKNKKIDELIEKELKENQKSNGGFEYSYPKISEIKQESRLDTGIYEREFKKIDFLIRNYAGGFNILNNFTKNLKSGSTPYFFEKKNGNYPYFIRPTEYGDKRTYDSLRKIHFDKNTSKYRIDREFGIILPRKGGVNAILKPENFDVLIGDSVKFGTFKNINTIFLASFLTSRIIKSQLEKIKSKTNGGSLTEKNLKEIPIPNFPDPKQQEIAKEYYNKIAKNQNLTLENYLTQEKNRNQQLGIFQLNMEIFTLREKLEDIIDKIINDQSIEINLNY